MNNKVFIKNVAVYKRQNDLCVKVYLKLIKGKMSSDFYQSARIRIRVNHDYHVPKQDVFEMQPETMQLCRLGTQESIKCFIS